MEGKPRRLGRGIGSLLSVAPVDVEASSSPAGEVATNVVSIAVNAIQPSRYQPRRSFDQDQLAQLVLSIKASGVMQPIIVRELASAVGAIRYELIAGERRWRAAQAAGLGTLPALVKTLSDEEAAEWGLVENVQREDLNPMDRAHALRGLAERFGFTQEQMASRIGLDRTTVTNLLRLCDLEGPIAALIAAGRLSAGHGRALLAFPPGEERVRAATTAAQFGWSVRKVEQLARSRPQDRPDEAHVVTSPRDAVLRDLERQLGQHLGTKVLITADKQGKRGKVVVEFYGIDHFDGLLGKMGLRAP